MVWVSHQFPCDPLPDLFTGQVPTTDVQYNSEIVLFIVGQSRDNHSGDVLHSKFFGNLFANCTVDNVVVLVHNDWYKHSSPASNFLLEPRPELFVDLRQLYRCSWQRVD